VTDASRRGGGYVRRKWWRGRAAGYAVVGVGLLLVGLGVARGEAGRVFVKAVNVCLECIGIG
jgi:hypothetical protein